MSLDVDDEPPAEFVKLISAEGHEFIMEREVVLCSSTISTMLSGRGTWEETRGPIPTMELPKISTEILEKVVKYFHYKKRYDAEKERPDFPIGMDDLVPLLLAAHYLDT